MWFGEALVFLGLVSIAGGFAIALVLGAIGRGGDALRAVWNGWGLGIAMIFFAVLFLPGDEAEDVAGVPSAGLGGGEMITSTGSGGLGGGEAMMLPAFHDRAAGMSAAADDLEGLIIGAGEITTADEDEARELGYAFVDNDPEILYVPPDSDGLYELQELLSGASRSFAAACSELRIMGDREAARERYREGVAQLSEGIRLLKELEALAPAE